MSKMEKWILDTGDSRVENQENVKGEFLGKIEKADLDKQNELSILCDDSSKEKEELARKLQNADQNQQSLLRFEQF